MEDIRGRRVSYMEDKYALLIDVDNVSAKYLKPILDELSKYGNVTYKRAYGDWTKPSMSSWKSELLQNSITPIQQFSYTTGKNATDSAMIIDAMDMLYGSKLEGFCLVSSDSDFTKLASRLRESGKMVIGMGENKTPKPFRKACDIFTVLEVLVEENSQMSLLGQGNHETDNSVQSLTPKQEIEEAIVKMIMENENNDKETGLGEVGSRLTKLYPDFDVRQYGFSLLSKFLGTLSRLSLIKKGNQYTVRMRDDVTKREQLEAYIINLVYEAGKEGIMLALLGLRVREQYPDFNVRDYGYSHFKRYIQSFRKIETQEVRGHTVAYIAGRR